MPNTIVNLGDLKALADKYQRALKRHRGVRLLADGARGDSVSEETLQRLSDALATVQETIEEICEQPILAVQLIEVPEDKNAVARKKTTPKRRPRKR